MTKLTQTHNMETYVPVNLETITAQQKADTLNSLIFLTEKRVGHLKSYICDNFSKLDTVQVTRKRALPCLQYL